MNTKDFPRGEVILVEASAFTGVTVSKANAILIGGLAVYNYWEKDFRVLHIASGLRICVVGRWFATKPHAVRFCMMLHTIPGLDWTSRHVTLKDIAAGKEPDQDGCYYNTVSDIMIQYFAVSNRPSHIDVTLPKSPEPIRHEGVNKMFLENNFPFANKCNKVNLSYNAYFGIKLANLVK